MRMWMFRSKAGPAGGGGWHGRMGGGADTGVWGRRRDTRMASVREVACVWLARDMTSLAPAQRQLTLAVSAVDAPQELELGLQLLDGLRR